MSPLAVLSPAGWFVVHALWQGAFVAGLTAFVLSLLGRATPAWRYHLGCASLALMALAPIATVVTGLEGARRGMPAGAVESAFSVVDMPSVLWWASVLIPVVGALWLVGVGLQALRLGAEVRRISRLRATEAGGADDRTGLTPAQGRGWPGRPVRAIIRFTDDVVVPTVIGWRRPIILLPAPPTDGPKDARAATHGILLHELAHVARRDYLVNLFQVVADAILFFHPGARWISHQIRTEREYCCDDMALEAGADRAAYARALFSLERARVTGRLAVLASSGTLVDRLRRMAGEPSCALTPARGLVAMVLASTIAVTVLTVALIVPPSLPWKAEIRRRTQPPAGAALGQPGPGPGTPRRTTQR